MDRDKARGRVGYAVSSGRMLPARARLCTDCGNPAKEYDHYLGYEEIHHLDVEPVCKSCHFKREVGRPERLQEGSHLRQKLEAVRLGNLENAKLLVAFRFKTRRS